MPRHTGRRHGKRTGAGEVPTSGGQHLQKAIEALPDAPYWREQFHRRENNLKPHRRNSWRRDQIRWLERGRNGGDAEDLGP